MWRGSKPVAVNARAVNVAILILLLLELVSGLAGFLIGGLDGRWMFWLHRAGGLALVVLLAWKGGMAAKSYKRRGCGLKPGSRRSLASCASGRS